MADTTYHDKDRVLISTIIAIIIHGVLFVGLHFILNIHIPPVPEYSGPLYLELGPEFSDPVITEESSRQDNRNEEIPEKVKDDQGETS